MAAGRLCGSKGLARLQGDALAGRRGPVEAYTTVHVTWACGRSQPAPGSQKGTDTPFQASGNLKKKKPK